MKKARMRLKVFSLIVLATLTARQPVQADDTNSAALIKIDATAASKHYGENVIVTGTVAQVAIRPMVVILYFGQPASNSPFTGVIFSRSTNQFHDLPSLKGKEVEVSGTIKPYHNKPEIILTNASQLTVSQAQPEIKGQAPVALPKQP
jgi:DNA/RNA endonuclease YhcR with UshA esterase domain